MLLPDFGEAGQSKLRASRVLLVGCGALGCAIADMLARAGVGRLTIVDRDVVELTNLQRQVLFDEADAAEGLPKAEAAQRRLRAVNSQVRVDAVVADFAPANAEKLLQASGPPTVLLDGTDNFETRYLLNDLAVKHGITYVYGGAVGTRGMAMNVLPGQGPCLRCLFEEPPAAGTMPTCDTAGVLGPLIQMVAAWQATEALKLMMGRSEVVSRSLMEIDAWSNARREIDVSATKRADCPCCGKRNFEFLGGARAGATLALCGQDAVQIAPPGTDVRIDLNALAVRMAAHGAFRAVGSFLIRGELVNEPGLNGMKIGLTVFADGRAIVKGTTRPEQARAIYARYVGS
jgi:adenylyltransferase/sulfurtransferase